MFSNPILGFNLKFLPTLLTVTSFYQTPIMEKLMESKIYYPHIITNKLENNNDQTSKIIYNSNKILMQNDNEEVNENDIKVINSEIYFNGPINEKNMKRLYFILKDLILNSQIFFLQYKTVMPIHLHIQSGGGSLLSSFEIVDLISDSPVPVYTYIDGYSASAASLITISGKTRYMTRNSFILIHQLSSMVGEGKFSEMEDNMKNQETFMNNIKKIYLEKTSINEEKLNQLLFHDLWLNAEDCLHLGFVDKII